MSSVTPSPWRSSTTRSPPTPCPRRCFRHNGSISPPRSSPTTIDWNGGRAFSQEIDRLPTRRQNFGQDDASRISQLRELRGLSPRPRRVSGLYCPAVANFSAVLSLYGRIFRSLLSRDIGPAFEEPLAQALAMAEIMRLFAGHRSRS